MQHVKYNPTSKIVWPHKTKICPHCSRRKPATLENFGPDKEGRICWCRKCVNKRTKKWTLENKAKARLRQKAWNLKTRYGISLAEYQQYWDAQGGACAICKLVKKLHVDHDHSTGDFRGLLCFECNAGLGNLKDSSSLLRSAANYLEEKE